MTFGLGHLGSPVTSFPYIPSMVFVSFLSRCYWHWQVVDLRECDSGRGGEIPSPRLCRLPDVPRHPVQSMFSLSKHGLNAKLLWVHGHGKFPPIPLQFGCCCQKAPMGSGQSGRGWEPLKLASILGISGTSHAIPHWDSVPPHDLWRTLQDAPPHGPLETSALALRHQQHQDINGQLGKSICRETAPLQTRNGCYRNISKKPRELRKHSTVDLQTFASLICFGIPTSKCRLWHGISSCLRHQASLRWHHMTAQNLSSIHDLKPLRYRGTIPVSPVLSAHVESSPPYEPYDPKIAPVAAVRWPLWRPNMHLITHRASAA